MNSPLNATVNTNIAGRDIDRQRSVPSYAFLPAVLLAVQSFCKSDLLAIGPFSIHGRYWWAYGVVRLVLLASLFVMLWLLPEKRNETHDQHSAPDVFEAIRAHADPLLGLRAVAFFLVFFGHWFFVVFAPAQPAESTAGFFIRSIISGSPWGGVWLFFCLSGYLIGKGFVSKRHRLNRSGIFNYYRNRALRIIPLYWVAVLLVSILEKPSLLNLGDRHNVIVLLDTLTFDLQGNGAIGALWSISTEFQFYLIAPLIFLALTKFSHQLGHFALLLVFTVAVGMIAKYLILESYPTRWHANVYFPLLSNLDCFLSGFITAFLVQLKWNQGFYIRHGVMIGAALTIILMIVISLWSYPEMVSFPNVPGSATRIYFLSCAPGVVALLSAAIIFLFEVAWRSPSSPSWLWQTQTFLGVLTYSLYIWHEPVIQALRMSFPHEMSFSRAFVALPLGFSLTLMVAWIFYFHIERFYDRKRRS